MTTDNVITFQLRRPRHVRRTRIERDDDGNLVLVPVYDEEAPTLQYVELRLDAACGVEMLLRDADGNVLATLEYALVSKPDDFDLDALQEAWARWRRQSEVVA